MYGGIKGVETMEIRILGTGGFSNDGSFYNCFTIDKHLLVETPPDILQSLHACSIQIEEIETILISHFHGDHCFGLPFLLFNMFIKRGSSLPSQSRLRLIAPPGVRDWMKKLLGLAISPDHPYIEWVLSTFEIIEIEENRRYELPQGLWLEFSPTHHNPLTFSILAGKNGDSSPTFIATSDTRWGPAIERLVQRGAKLLLCDSGGSKPGEVHMSPDEIRQYIIPKLPEDSRILGTHYAGRRISEGRLGIRQSGDLFLI
jgi:Metal-dependent hydrolases of the beta-lactamase superfamily III